MNLGLLALIFWLATAGFGTLMLYWWIGRIARATRRARLAHSRPPPYIPRLLVVSHVLLALGGLAAWTAAILAFDELAYAALPTLIVVAFLGGSMFVRWLGSRRARRAAAALHRAPPVSRLPTAVVLGHGLLGLTTVFLVLLSYFRPTIF
jgi:hypothetical protein